MANEKYLKWSNTNVCALLLYNRVLSDAEIRKNLDIFDQWYTSD